MSGQQKVLTIATSSESPDAGRTTVAAADLEPSRLFEFLLLDCKPIAAPSRRYSSEDTKFIRSEVQRLLDADIVELVRSHWRAQDLAVKQGEKKKCLCYLKNGTTPPVKLMVSFFSTNACCLVLPTASLPSNGL